MTIEEIGKLTFTQINMILDYHAEAVKEKNEKKRKTLKSFKKYTAMLDILKLAE